MKESFDLALKRSKPKKTSFSAGSWLFQKIKFPYLICFFLTFVVCYFQSLIKFNIRANFNQKNPGRGYLNWFFKKQNINSSSNPQWYIKLLLILVSSFLLGVFLTSLINLFLKSYCVESSKNWLRKLIIYLCWKSPTEKVNLWQAKINDIVFNHIPVLSFYFINLPLKTFSILVGIIFEIYFLGFFLNSKNIENKIKILALWFNLIVILIILFYMLLTAWWQKQVNLKKSQQSQIEKQQIQTALNNLTWMEEKQKKERIIKLFKFLDRNLKRKETFFLSKIAFSLPTLIIPGLNVIFYFLYYRYSVPDFKDAFIIYLLSLSIQSIFWKIKKLLQQALDYQKFWIRYQEFNSLIEFLKS